MKPTSVVEGTLKTAAALTVDGRQRRPIEVVDWPMVQILRQKTEAQRLAISSGMWKSAREMLSNLLCAEHPEWSENDIRQP